jgi:rhamnogalacturonyl hydrolase YesR
MEKHENSESTRHRPTRRWSGALLASPFLKGQPGFSMKAELPRGTPPGVAAIIKRTLGEQPAAINTDWFGTCLMKGLLEWTGRGGPEGREFARAWFESHLNSKEVSSYSGSKGRVVRVGGIPITTYAGHFGLAFPCFELYRQLRDERARRVCIEVADLILHQTARNRFGMVMHEDGADFTIPDVCFFAVVPLMIAFRLDQEQGRVYRDQAVFQLRAFNDVFLDKETGLARTILYKDGLGKTYWTRATGWLLWAICGVLRHLPPDDPQRQGFIDDLNLLARGIERSQDSSGGLRVLLNEPASPLETTGTAMCAMGLHEAIRMRWIRAAFAGTSDRAWEFVKSRVTTDGEVVGAYTGWAVPAEKGVMTMDDKSRMGWIPGFILSAAAEMAEG